MALFALYHSAHRAPCSELNLVLHSMAIESEVILHEGRFYLLVEEATAETAYQQLKTYVAENAPEQIIKKPLRPLRKGYAAAYLYAIILLVIGVLQNSLAFNLDWTQIGLADSYKINAGHWWLNFTALTLHADIAHLAGNIGFGILFGILVTQHLGSGAAWFSILFAGATGNGVNAYLYQSLHQSLGASTMVFAALGMLGVFSLSTRYDYRQRGLRRWLPFLATVALLAFTGTAGENTDVLAHLSGFGSGCVAALIWRSIGTEQTNSSRWQWTLGGASILLVLLSWSLALSYR